MDDGAERRAAVWLACGPARGERRDPRYPTWLTMQSSPSVLRQHLPSAWRRQAKLGILVGTLLGSTAGEPPPRSDGERVVNVLRDFRRSSAALGEVIMSGGMRMAFLSEQDARKVICDELATHGVQLPLADQMLPDVIIAGHEWQSRYSWIDRRLQDRHVPTSRPLVVDLMDAERGIAIEYVAPEDYELLGGPGYYGSQAYESTHAAALRKVVAQQAPRLHFWAFHGESAPWMPVRVTQQTTQPVAGPATQPAAESRPAVDPLEEARERLRAQVREFVEWLQGQGVI